MSFAFVITTYNDQHLVPRLLQQINKHCPGIQVIVIGDGVKLEESLKQGTTWFECERAKGQGQKGLWTQRFLEIFLKYSTATHLIKLDPDSCIWRPFTLPEGNYDLCGNIKHKRYKHPYIRGGCVVNTRLAAQKIVDSQILLEDKYEEYNYSRYKIHRWDHEKQSDELIALQDWIMGDVIYRLQLVLQEWNEIFIVRKKISIQIENFAITHPHPTLEETSEYFINSKSAIIPQKSEEADLLVNNILGIWKNQQKNVF